MQRRILSLTHPILPPGRVHRCAHASTWIPPQVFISRKLTSEPFQERRGSGVQLMGPGIFVRLSAILVFQVLGVSRIRLDQRRIDARGSCFIYSNSSGPVFPLSTQASYLPALRGLRGFSRGDWWFVWWGNTSIIHENLRDRSHDRVRELRLGRMINLECLKFVSRSIHFSMKKVVKWNFPRDQSSQRNLIRLFGIIVKSWYIIIWICPRE